LITLEIHHKTTQSLPTAREPQAEFRDMRGDQLKSKN
jgi:hypothetical protein